MRVDLLSEKELQAVKKVSEYCDFYEDCNFDVEHALDIDWVTIEDEDFLDEQFY